MPQALAYTPPERLLTRARTLCRARFRPLFPSSRHSQTGRTSGSRGFRTPPVATYADDVIVEIAKQHRCYIVATCDRDLKRRIRKIPGVPIMFVHNHRYSVERLPEATVGGAPRF